MNLPYNPEDKTSIITYAKLLKGKTLKEVCDENILENINLDKGNFGKILEEFYFLYA